MKLFNKSKNQFISQVVILSIIFGFGAGVVGQIVTEVYFDPYGQDLLYDNLNTNINSSNIVPELRRVKKFLGIEQDFEVNNSIEKTKQALVGVYLKKPESQSILKQAYLPQALKANGFILTSDGWLVSHGDIFKDHNIDELVVLHQGKVFEIEQAVVDSTTGVVFIKIAAGNLPVVVLGDSDELILGQLSIGLNSLNNATVTTIKNTNDFILEAEKDLVMYSEKYGNAILLNTALSNQYLGSPLVNLGGEVVGIISGNGQQSGQARVIPINQFRSIILDVLRNNLIKRPYLGVSYIDLAWVNGIDIGLTQGLNRGALVYQNPDKLTPAAEFGLLKNDIILSIDGQLIDKDSSLTSLVQQYQPGDEINLEILREGKNITGTVNLAVLQE